MSIPIKVTIDKSTSSGKKYMAIFTLDNGHTKTIHFGAKGYSDFTIHKDEERKKRYIARHKVHEDWTDPMTAGTLSRYVLWNKTSINESIKEFKARFNLN